MAVAAWPATLPQVPLLAGQSETPPDNLIRTQMEAGVAKVRPRYTARGKQITFEMVMSETQVDTLDTFFKATLTYGAKRFTFPDPRTDVSTEWRFLQPPRWTPTGRHFRVSISLEEMP